METGGIWDAAIEFVSLKNAGRFQSQRNLSRLASILKSLQENDFFDFYEELALDNFREDLKERIIPTFCKQVVSNGVSNLSSSVKELHGNILWYHQLLSVWPKPTELAFKLRDIFISCLLWELDSKVKDVFAEFYAHAFQVTNWKSQQEKLDEISMEDDEECNEEYITLEWNKKSRKMRKDYCETFLEQEFLPLASLYLYDLDLLFTLAEQPISQVLEIEIRRHVDRTCTGQYEKQWINDHLKNWVETEVMQWLESVFWKTWDGIQRREEFQYRPQIKSSGHTREKWRQKLSFILYETYTEMRIGEMFGIITDFPESSPAIEDLKLCLERTNQIPYLIETLRNDLSNRVLHLGVSTEDIITVYINAVKALRLLDPSGVVMEIVLESYTKYLVSRDDSVKQIMTCLLDEDRDNDLAMELAQGTTESAAPPPLHPADPNESFFVEEVTERYEDWVPDPREADPEKPDKSRRRSDIISLLIGMYGSTVCFIQEYQELLSRRLQTNWCSGTSEDAEIKNLELLKLRFGETDMEKCAVMLKDVADSRRINAYIKEESTKHKNEEEEEAKDKIDVHTLIVSSEYWPEFSNQDLVLPPAAQEALDFFNTQYEGHKASRSLHWLHSAGRVDIELELNGETVKFQVSPLLASVIYLFQDKETWNLEEINCELKVPETVLRRKIVFWLQQGLLTQTAADTYTLIEENGSRESISPRSSMYGKNDLQNIMEEEPEEDTEAEDAKQKQQEEVLWNYIQGMLMNFTSMPLDRITKMLRLFAMQDTSMLMDQNKLRTFLNRKVQEGLLSIEGGKYKLSKDS